MDPGTAEQVQAAVAEHGIQQWALRSCSSCTVSLYYVFDNGRVGFAPGCGCSDSGVIYERSYSDLAGTFNMQTPEVRARMWDDFLKAGQPKSIT